MKHTSSPQNYECFLTKTFDMSIMANNLDKELLIEYQSTAAIRHYHGGMSEAYLQVVYSALLSMTADVRFCVRPPVNSCF